MCVWKFVVPDPTHHFVLILRVIKFKPPVSWKQMFSSDMTFSCYTLAAGPKHRVGRINSWHNAPMQPSAKQLPENITEAQVPHPVVLGFFSEESSHKMISLLNSYNSRNVVSLRLWLAQKFLSNRNSHVGPCWRKGQLFLPANHGFKAHQFAIKLKMSWNHSFSFSFLQYKYIYIYKGISKSTFAFIVLINDIDFHIHIRIYIINFNIHIKTNINIFAVRAKNLRYFVHFWLKRIRWCGPKTNKREMLWKKKYLITKKRKNTPSTRNTNTKPERQIGSHQLIAMF